MSTQKRIVCDGCQSEIKDSPNVLITMGDGARPVIKFTICVNGRRRYLDLCRKCATTTLSTATMQFEGDDLTLFLSPRLTTYLELYRMKQQVDNAKYTGIDNVMSFIWTNLSDEEREQSEYYLEKIDARS